MDFKLNDKVALVTGAGSPIGFGKAIALAGEGCNLVVTYNKNAVRTEKTVAEINNLGRKSMAVKVDVRDGAEVKNIIDAAIRQWGKIDILVNNAGDPATPPKPFVETIPSVLYILATPGNNAKEAIVRAVNDTYDNDTVATIVGAAVGTLHGVVIIPQRWLNRLQGNIRKVGSRYQVFRLTLLAKKEFWLT